MNDGKVIWENFLTIAVLGTVFYIIYQKVMGDSSDGPLDKVKDMFKISKFNFKK